MNSKTNVKVDPEQTSLTEDQNKALAEEAFAEVEAEEKGEKVVYGDKEPEEEDSEPSKKPEDEETEPLEKEEGEEGEEEEDDEESENDDSEADPEDDEDKEKKEDDEPKQIEEDIIKEHALKNELTLEEAKDDIEKTKAVVAKYKNDPIELAKALRSTQSAYDKLKEQKPEETKSNKQELLRDPSADIGKHINDNADELLEQYKAKYPNKSEFLTDEAILEEIGERMFDRYEAWAKEETGKMKEAAVNKRDEVLNSLSKEDAVFLPDIKAVLSKTSDAQVMRDSFDLTDLVRWAKGGKYDDDVKKAREEGIRIGKEGAEIVGDKTPSSNKSRSPKQIHRKSSSALNGDQKERAIQMYDHIEGDDESRFKLYRETFADELIKDPAFIG